VSLMLRDMGFGPVTDFRWFHADLYLAYSGLAFGGTPSYSATVSGFLMFGFVYKDGVSNRIPGVMNANEKQQQCRRCNAKECVGNIRASRVRRSRQCCIGS